LFDDHRDHDRMVRIRDWNLQVEPSRGMAASLRNENTVTEIKNKALMRNRCTASTTSVNSSSAAWDAYSSRSSSVSVCISRSTTCYVAKLTPRSLDSGRRLRHAQHVDWSQCLVQPRRMHSHFCRRLGRRGLPCCFDQNARKAHIRGLGRPFRHSCLEYV
jgi:hypothetical protein